MKEERSSMVVGWGKQYPKKRWSELSRREKFSFLLSLVFLMSVIEPFWSFVVYRHLENSGTVHVVRTLWEVAQKIME